MDKENRAQPVDMPEKIWVDTSTIRLVDLGSYSEEVDIYYEDNGDKDDVMYTRGGGGGGVSQNNTDKSFQDRVQPWLLECFGEKIAGDRLERNHRFLEEALELVQSCEMTKSEAYQLVDYVYGRPIGDPPQEVGGVMITLAALCLANDMDMDECGETELSRIWTKVESIRAKQAAKPKNSPLAMHQESTANKLDKLANTPVEFEYPNPRGMGDVSEPSYNKKGSIELAEEIHEACHEACLECPQFMCLDDDSLVETHTGALGRFDSIPNRGVAYTIRFWMDEETLWEFGYEEHLPDYIRCIFNDVNDIMDEALTNYANNLEN